MVDKFKREIRACENIMVQKENENKWINGLRKIRQQQNEKHDLKEIMERIRDTIVRMKNTTFFILYSLENDC